MPYNLRTSYADLTKFFQINSCSLLTSEEDIITNNLTSKSIFKFIGKCGHNTETKLRIIKTSNYSFLCKKCKNELISNKYKNNKNYGIKRGIEIETNSFNYIKQFLIGKIDFHRTYEGCRADIIIRPLNSKEDKWLPIQLKGATFNEKNQCRFRHVNNYNNYLMCCIGITNTNYKLWMFNGSLCSQYNGITISLNSKKYSIYEVSYDKIIDKLINCYNDNNYSYVSYNDSMIPVAKNCKTEHFNRIKRNEYLSLHINIHYSHEMNNIYDCIINGLKVQDKTGHPHRYGISFGINKKLNKKSIPYEEGDVNIFWLHIPNSSKFYVIPESLLIKHNYIKTFNQSGKTTLILFPESGKRKNSKQWSQTYLFDYNTLDIKKLKEILL